MSKFDRLQTSTTSPSGLPRDLPSHLQGVNWGAFFLTFIWGIFNNTYMALLVFVPIVGLFMPFVLLFMGNEWAWKNRVWADEAEFRESVRKWNIAGWLVFFAMFIVAGLAFIGLFFFIVGMTRGDAYQMAWERVRSEPQVVALVGEPMESSFFVGGKYNEDPEKGTATQNFTITGPKGEATVSFEAEKTKGEWKLYKLEVEAADGTRVQILPPLKTHLLPPAMPDAGLAAFPGMPPTAIPAAMPAPGS